MMGKLIARLYIIFFSSIAIVGGIIFGLMAGIDCYVRTQSWWRGLLIGILATAGFFFPVGLLCGFALCDEQVWHNAEW
jgi:hypothetical protein